jgi:hypothetical protein
MVLLISTSSVARITGDSLLKHLLKRKAVEEVSPKTGHWGKKWREGQAWIILAKDGAPGSLPLEPLHQPNM